MNLLARASYFFEPKIDTYEQRYWGGLVQIDAITVMKISLRYQGTAP